MTTVFHLVDGHEIMRPGMTDRSGSASGAEDGDAR